jgi:hypothetical protein
MSKAEKKVSFSKAVYIKLGRGGSWEKESLEKGILRFGYNETPFEAAKAADWDTVWKAWRDMRGDDGTATRDVTQIRNFFEDGKEPFGSPSAVVCSGGVSQNPVSRSIPTNTAPIVNACVAGKAPT